MAYRLDIKRILSMNFFHDLPKIMFGCALAAIATDLFLIPNGLAAGGVTGLATIIQAVGASHGISLPVGIQTIVMNALLLLVVMREGGMFYVVQTATGFVLLGFFTDLFAPFVAPLAHADLMLPAMWGGIITGIGYGMVLRAGANSAAPIQSPEQARNALRAVTKDEVRDILRRLTLSVSYLLTKEDAAHAAE